MGKLARLITSSIQSVYTQTSSITASLFRHLGHISGWLIRKLSDWTAILWVVAALWAFGGIMTSIALAEAVPSELELAFTALLFSLGNIILGVRICIAAWQSKELNSISHKITITVFVTMSACLLTSLEDIYLMGKEPTLLLDAFVFRPPAPPPQTESSATPRPVKPLTPARAIIIKNVAISEAQEVGAKSAATVSVRNNTGSAFDVRIWYIAALWSYFGDQEKDWSVQEQLWNKLVSYTKTKVAAKQTLPFTDATVNIPVASGPSTAEDIADIKSHSKIPYMLLIVKDSTNKTILEFCAYMPPNGDLSYCRLHNGP